MPKDPRRTEPATRKQRDRVRNEGQVARSEELTNSAIFVAIIINFYFFSNYVFRHLFDIFRWGFSDNLLKNMNQANIYSLLLLVMKEILITLAPWLIIIFSIGLLVNIAQVGWHVTYNPIQPKLSKLFRGLPRFFSKESLITLLKSIIKMIIIGWPIYNVLKDEIENILPLMDQPLFDSFSYTANLTYRIFFKVIIIFLPLGILDYLYQKHEFEESIKMTKEEVKDERRQAEGDPEVKSKIKTKQMELAMRRMFKQIPKADVVITNPTHLAIALHYDKTTMDAPKVVAKGAGFVAERIKKIAEEHGVPIIENKPLTRALFKLVEIGDSIPENFYKAVAEVLAYVYKLKNKI